MKKKLKFEIEKNQINQNGYMISKGDMNIGSTDDSGSASSADDCSTESFDDPNKKNKKINKKKIEYFVPDQLQLFFEGYIYKRVGREVNFDKTWRWRRSYCNGCALKTKGKYINKEPTSKCTYICLKLIKL